MALKTFNLDEKIYKEFSKYCKEHGISMSKKVEKFIKRELDALNQPIKQFKSMSNNKHPMEKYC